MRLCTCGGLVQDYNSLADLTLRSNDCTTQLGKSDEAALEPYKRLRAFVPRLQQLQEAAEGAAPHLVDYVAKAAQGLGDRIARSFSADFEATLKKIYWPKADITIPPELQQEWSKNIGRLLDLQRGELEARDNANRNKAKKEEPLVLLPLEVMVRPLEQRFQYHFSGDRPTNRLDKPEYFLSHVLDLLNTYSPFFQASLQPLLLAHFRTSDLAFTPAYIDSNSAFINALLPLLQRKLQSILPQLISQPNLFSNLIHEVMSFDTTLADEWNYAPLSPSTPYRGLSHYILDTLSYFDRWLKIERDFALSRYESIISSQGSFELDFDAADPGTTKPTRAAIRVNDLLETITDRYRTLSSFTQKVRFLIDVQVDIFDLFRQRLYDGLDVYLQRTASIGRLGVSAEERAEVAGVRGIERLCRVFGSAEYMVRKMRDWSDDVFFLELHEEMLFRQTNPNTPLDVRFGDRAAKMKGADDEDGELQSALFDETSSAYASLRTRSENTIVDALKYNVREALRNYTRINPWASLAASGSTDVGATSTLTAEIEPAVRLLDEYLGFLAKALGTAPLRRIARAVAGSVQAFLWDRVLLAHRFSTGGAAQLASDVGALRKIFDRHVGAEQGASGMRRLSEGLVMLTLPVKGEIPVEIVDGDDAEGTRDGKRMGLWEVERRVFMSNEDARDVLEELGLEVLSESDARDVLQRRVELGS